MNIKSWAAIPLIAVAGCGVPAPEPTGEEWTGTVTSEGDATTVINESGSVWGDGASLVEEASIGVDSGAEPYLFGNVVGVGVADDRIFVLDAQVHLVRAYDLDGNHLTDLGAQGQGPGEFERPTGLAVAPGRLYVRDPRNGRITVFSTDGELVDTWPTEAYYTSLPIVATVTGELLVPYRGGMTPWGPDGEAGATIPYPPVEERAPQMTIRVEEAIEGYSPGAMLGRHVPVWPLPVFAFAPTGAMIHGVGDAYRFTIEQPDGGAIHVQGAAEPVAVSVAEADWYRERVAAYMRQADAGWQWDGPEVPETKPAFTGFVPAVSGEVWVIRPGAGYEDTHCEADIPTREPPPSCWHDTRIVDVFGTEGRFLGTLNVPQELRLEPRPFVSNDTVVGIVQDDAGTVMVKRYRLVPSAQERR